MKMKRDIEQTLNIWEKEYKKGFTAYMLLMLLIERPMYGYEMKQALESSAEQKVLFKESAIYQILKSMNKKGFVESYWDVSALGPRRKYYRLTSSGKELLQSFTQQCILPMNSLLNSTLNGASEALGLQRYKETQMEINTMPPLQIGGLTIPVPIIQGGMGVGISLSRLAAAVANQGGVGVISAVGMGLIHPNEEVGFAQANLDGLREEIRLARSMTNGVLGVNIMLALSDYDDLLKVTMEEEVDIVFLGAGLPIKQPKTLTFEELHNSKTRVAVIVSSARAAKLVLSHWSRKFHHLPDMIVVEGPKAGGHLGFSIEQIDDPEFALEKLIPQVCETVAEFEDEFDKKIPVIAAGGVFSGNDIHQMLDLGASGVQMGTRFVATEECDADEEFKQLYIGCEQEDIKIIKSPVGLPGRAIQNQFLQEVMSGRKRPFDCKWKCLKTCKLEESQYCIARALANAKLGLFSEGFAFAGANAFLVDKIITVKELFDTLAEEFCASFIIDAQASC